MNRRGLLFGFGALLAAPSIVRVSSLMAIKPLPSLQEFVVLGANTEDDAFAAQFRVEFIHAFKESVELLRKTVGTEALHFADSHQGMKVGDRFTIEGVRLALKLAA